MRLKERGDPSVPKWQEALSLLSQVVRGADMPLRLALAALLARQHILIDDVPGVGKTTLAKALARITGLSFSRIQFTPDLLPGDLTGGLYPDGKGSLSFKPGPLFAGVVLADEVNRASPKTQSALLEAMEEGQVTVDGRTYPLPRPFLLLATKNPLEEEGTFLLPEAQMDRFGISFRLGYPPTDVEVQLLMGQNPAELIPELPVLFTPEELLALQAEVASLHLHHRVALYIVHLVQATRRHGSLAVGASPRAAMVWARMARAWAFLKERSYVIPDDVQEVAPYVLGHRLLPQGEARWKRDQVEKAVAEILKETPLPREMVR